MKSENITSVVLTIIFVIALFVAFLATEKEVEEMEIEMKALQEQKQEMQIKNEELKKEDVVIPNIDCKTEMEEGDIRVRIAIELYDPFGEWTEITEENARYQIRNGGRVIICK